MTDPEATRLVLGLAAAIERHDQAAWAALLHGGDGPVDPRLLLRAALVVIRDQAGEAGEGEDPPVGAAEVLARWALVAAADD